MSGRVSEADDSTHPGLAVELASLYAPRLPHWFAPERAAQAYLSEVVVARGVRHYLTPDVYTR